MDVSSFTVRPPAIPKALTSQTSTNKWFHHRSTLELDGEKGSDEIPVVAGVTSQVRQKMAQTAERRVKAEAFLKDKEKSVTGKAQAQR